MATTVKKSNKVTNYPKCVVCPREDPSLHGECFIAIPSQLNVNGKWKGTHWHLFCGNCFNKLTKQIGVETEPIGKIDFMNLFNGIPITIFKEKYKTRLEFKAY
jgi:hypothetical protein